MTNIKKNFGSINWIRLFIFSLVGSLIGGFIASQEGNVSFDKIKHIVIGAMCGALVEALIWFYIDIKSSSKKLEDNVLEIGNSVKLINSQLGYEEMIKQLANTSPFTGILGTLYFHSEGKKIIHNVDRGKYFEYLNEAIKLVQGSYETIQHSGIGFFAGKEDFFDEFTDVEVKCTRIFLHRSKQDIELEKKEKKKWNRYWNRVGKSTKSYWVVSSRLDNEITALEKKGRINLDPLARLGEVDVVLCDRKLLFQYDAKEKTLTFDHNPNRGGLKYEWVFDFLKDDLNKPQQKCFIEIPPPASWIERRYIRFREGRGMTVNLDSISNNLLEIMRLCSGMKLILVLKSDAYGLGITRIAKHILKSNTNKPIIGVGSLMEASQIRELDKEVEILVMEGVLTEEVHLIIKNRLNAMVWDEYMLDHLNEEAKGQNVKVKVHIKVETGMNRLGVKPKKLQSLLTKLKSLQYLELAGLATHFSIGQDPEHKLTIKQIEVFKKCVNIINNEIDIEKIIIHIGNSPSLLSGVGSDYNAIRIGGLLYGLKHPLPKKYVNKKAHNIKLKSCVKVFGRINQIQDVGPNSCVSYNAKPFPRKEGGKVAITNMGYFDGIPTQFANKGEALIKGKRCKVVGDVPLGLTMFDVTDIDCEAGDEVVFIGDAGGERIDVSEFADMCGCHPYEVLCRFGNTLLVHYIDSFQ